MTLPRRANILWVGVLLLVLGVLAWDTRARMEKLRRVDEITGLSPRPEIDPTSPTGYALGQRTLVLSDIGTDGYHWIMQTQQMFASGERRVRKVSYDNAPVGREVHWASPYRWWLGSLAWAETLFSKRPIAHAVESAAVYASPLLLGFGLLVLAPIIARRFGAIAAAIFSTGMLSPSLYDYFVAGNPDHHGLVTLCSVLSVVCVIAGGAGWIQRPSPEPGGTTPVYGWLPDYTSARRWFIASGLAGGIGLWVSAATQAPVIIGLGIAGFAVVIFGRRATRPNTVQLETSLWRTWGITGAVTSAVAYLIEYAPAHMELRLEVNHPLYAVAWLGAGELLRLLGSIRGTGLRFSTREIVMATAAALAIAQLPLVTWLTRRETFLVSDPFLWALHKEYIAEFQSVVTYLGRHQFDFATFAMCVPAVWLAGLLACLFFRSIPVPVRALLAVAFFPAAFVFMMTLGQVRWWGLGLALMLPLLCTAFSPALWPHMRPHRFVCSLAGMTLALFLVAGPWQLWRQHGHGVTFGKDDVLSPVMRDAAWFLRARMGEEPATVVSSPTITTPLIYHGGLRGLGTLYWENLNGLKKAAEFFAAHSSSEAESIARKHGITHVVIPSWNQFAGGYTRLIRGLPRGAPLPDDAFLPALISGRAAPAWLRRIPYPLLSHTALEGEEIFIFEVVAPQTAAEQAARTVHYLLEMNRVAEAEAHHAQLASHQDSLIALVALGRLQAQLEQAEPFIQTIQTLRSQLGATSRLALEDRVHLAALLTMARDEDQARHQLELCLSQADSREIHRLPPSAQYYLVLLSQQYGFRDNQSGHLKLARSLLPATMRAQLAMPTP